MKSTLFFLLGVFAAISIAASTTDLMTVKPATPKQTVVFDTDLGSDDVIYRVKPLLRQGYIVKSISGTSQFGTTWIVVMEKY